MKIGKIETKGNIFLAPLAGYTDVAFRRLCRDFGASLTTTEMISVSGLNYRNQKTDGMTVIAPNEQPSCVQLFGREAEQFSRAVTHHGIIPFDIIDVNMGCPMRKVTSNGEGAALMNDPARAAEIVRALKNACDKPITVKMRLGMKDAGGAVDFAKRMEDAGADMLTVHGRTAAQLYGGQADWEAIRKIARAVSVPVIGNGDVSEDNITERLDELSGIAVGRAAIGNPQIFSEKKFTVYEVVTRHIEYVAQYFSEKYLCSSIRKFFSHYLKGIRGNKVIKDEIFRAVKKEQLDGIIEKYKTELGEHVSEENNS